MSTLAEIEAAAAKLPAEQQEELIRFLTTQRRTDRIPTTAQRSQRGFPISQGAAPFGSEDVARIEREADAR